MAGLEYITTCTPMRISFAGGGTDLPAFYRREGGAVFSTAIDKHIYVTVKRLSDFFERSYRLNYSESEIVTSLDDMRNSIARECLRLVPVDPPLYIATIADIPANSGLGASSSFAVGLLTALHAMRGERVSPAQIAEEAIRVEVEQLNRPVGKQDHYAAAFGGLNYICFDRNERVTVEPQPLEAREIKDLFDQLLIFWTGITRDAGAVLSEQNHRTEINLDGLRQMRSQAQAMRDLFLTGLDIERFGMILDEGWRQKRALAGTITNDSIDVWYDAAKAAGAIGGKLCGAGGGGFLMFVAQRERHHAIRKALGNLRELKVNYEPFGAQLLLQSAG